MTQVGRNDACSCGSGKKYKKCCLPTNEEQARKRLREAHEQARRLEQEMRDLATRRADQQQTQRKIQTAWAQDLAWYDDLDLLSNSVLDLIDQCRYDEALTVCDRLLLEYPDVHDGFDRSAMVHDALGNHAIAASFWQKAVEFVEHPDRRDDYDEALIEDFRQHMRRAQQRAAEAAEALQEQSADQERAP